MILLASAAALLSLVGAMEADPTLEVSSSSAQLNWRGTAALGGLLGVATAIVFLVWVSKTARRLKAQGLLASSPGWVLGSWFIPVGNLVFPFLALRGGWRRARAGPSAWFDAWWAAFVARVLLLAWEVAWALMHGFERAKGLPDGVQGRIALPDGLATLDLVASIALVVACIPLAYVVVKFDAAPGPAAATSPSEPSTRPGPAR